MSSSPRFKECPHRNLAVELLEKLLKGEVSTRRRKNVVQARSFAEMLEKTLRSYQNRAIEAAQVIEELIALAREMREANARGEQLGLSEDELAFYDALETNDSAVQDPRRRDPSRHRPRSCGDRSQQRHHRLDPPRKRPSQPPPPGPPHPSADTATHPTSRKEPPKQSSNKPKSSPKAGPPPNRRLSPIPASVARTASTACTDCISGSDAIANTCHPRPRSAPRRCFRSKRSAAEPRNLAFRPRPIPNQAAPPKTGHIARQSGHIPLETEHIRPKTGHIRPKTGHIAPKTEHIRPTA